MSHNYYSEIYLHIVWHTKNSLPLLTPIVGPDAHQMLNECIIDTPGALMHAIGGIATHVHIAVSVPPTLTPSEWIGRLKGRSAHDVNQSVVKRQKVLQWQTGYGIVSFGKKDLPWVISYVRRQREHHALGNPEHRLERITHDDA